MGALGWEIHRQNKLVVVSGVGIFDIAFLKSYRQGMQAAGVINYRKLFDLHQSDIRLSAEDLQGVAENARNNNASIAGPLAVLIGRDPPPLLVDMAILLKHRVGNARRFRLFKEEEEARRWLASEPILIEGATSSLIAIDTGLGSGHRH